jgi:hypothetical protein
MADYAIAENLYHSDFTTKAIRYVDDDVIRPVSLADIFVFRRARLSKIDPAARFSALARQWEEETRYLSSSTQIVLHPAYQQIIGMGAVAVPFILAQLQSEPHHWFWALRAITGEDPVSVEHVGDVGAMAEEWLQWGRDRDLL